jgi:hypothetical protein
MTDHAQKKFQNLKLALIGNCRVAALVECHARIVRWCFLCFDSDSIFLRLLAGEAILGRHNAVQAPIRGHSPETGELWGNSPQTYSMAGLINTAARLSSSWEEA